MDHLVRQCKSSVRCLRCNELGHIARRCPSPRHGGSTASSHGGSSSPPAHGASSPPPILGCISPPPPSVSFADLAMPQAAEPGGRIRFGCWACGAAMAIVPLSDANPPLRPADCPIQTPRTSAEGSSNVGLRAPPSGQVVIGSGTGFWYAPEFSDDLDVPDDSTSSVFSDLSLDHLLLPPFTSLQPPSSPPGATDSPSSSTPQGLKFSSVLPTSSALPLPPSDLTPASSNLLSSPSISSESSVSPPKKPSCSPESVALQVYLSPIPADLPPKCLDQVCSKPAVPLETVLAASPEISSSTAMGPPDLSPVVAEPPPLSDLPPDLFQASADLQSGPSAPEFSSPSVVLPEKKTGTAAVPPVMGGSDGRQSFPSPLPPLLLHGSRSSLPLSHHREPPTTKSPTGVNSGSRIFRFWGGMVLS